MKSLPHYRPIHPEWGKFFKQLSTTKSRGFPVCFSGEKGVGKDFCARLLLARMGVAVTQVEIVSANTGAIPPKLDPRIKVVYFAQENSLSLERQREILRFFESMGSRIQVIWTGKISLQRQLEEGAISEEFFYALNLLDYRLPGIAEMAEDLESFANHFLTEICLEASLSPVKLNQEQVQAMKKQVWPANLDTLNYVIRRSAAQSSGAKFELNLGFLPTSHIEKSVQFAAHHEEVISGVPVDRLEKSVNEFKKKLVIETIKKAGGNKSNAAKLLGVSKAYIFRLIQVLDIDLD